MSNSAQTTTAPSQEAPTRRILAFEGAVNTRQLLVRYLRPLRWRVAVLALLLGTSIALPLMGPQILRNFIDSALAGSPLDLLIRLAGLYLLVAAARQLVSVGTIYVSEQLGWRATNPLRSDLLRHVLGLDMTFHNTHTPGEMIERVDGDVTALSNFFSQFILSIIGSILLGTAILVLMFREDIRIGAVMAAFAIVSITFMAWLRRRATDDARAWREAAARHFGFIEERLAGVDDIRANGAGGHVLRGFAGVARNFLGADMRSERSGSLIWVASMALYSSSLALILGLAAWLFAAGAITEGTVVLLFQYTLMLDSPISEIAAQLKDFQLAAAGIERIRELTEQSTALRDGVQDLEEDGPVRLSFEDVTFTYEDDVPVLSNVSFTIEPGQVLGVLGRTGSGKTTLTRLISRLYDVRRGAVQLDGHDVRSIRLESLRRRVGVVSQDVQLFEGTVRDNLTMFDDGVYDGRIVKVLADLGLLDWYATLSEGLDSRLRSGGERLSAGEAQLLAFARMFLKSPGLVVLDEASSRLDPATESLLERAVDRLLENRTGIVIAHRLRTVQRADVILILEDGRIAEFGRRAELVADPTSRFSQLMRTGIEEVLV
jgi:ATP-binding cassette, subfamily B, bacterial